MALPASLLAAAEGHACFTGCYRHETPVSLCIDPLRPPVTSFHAACQDCIMYHVGSLASLLPPGMTQYGLAQELSAHMRAVRGYRWAISGYHATGQGFWLSVAYYGDGLFLVDTSRNHGASKTDVQHLVQAFRSKLIQPDDQGMLDPALYASEIVYLSCSPALRGVRTKQDILRSPQCGLSPRRGLSRVCIVEYLPMTTKNSASGASAQSTTISVSPPPQAAPPPEEYWDATNVGDVCALCRKTVRELSLGGVIGYNCGCR